MYFVQYIDIDQLLLCPVVLLALTFQTTLFLNFYPGDSVCFMRLGKFVNEWQKIENH